MMTPMIGGQISNGKQMRKNGGLNYTISAASYSSIATESTSGYIQSSLRTSEMSEKKKQSLTLSPIYLARAQFDLTVVTPDTAARKVLLH